MSSTVAKFLGFFAIAAAAAGCFPSPRPAQVVSRNVTAVAAGGPAEVWVVMGETGTEVNKDGAFINKDNYALYHCIPQGCKRVSELKGTQVTAR
ncbi:MAG: hypothetical protein IT377_21535 [Polyangiaceae bacterium]|nr:hypothetical protein [Polyangiaceae bacterium]